MNSAHSDETKDRDPAFPYDDVFVYGDVRKYPALDPAQSAGYADLWRMGGAARLLLALRDGYSIFYRDYKLTKDLHTRAEIARGIFSQQSTILNKVLDDTIKMATIGGGGAPHGMDIRQIMFTVNFRLGTFCEALLPHGASPKEFLDDIVVDHAYTEAWRKPVGEGRYLHIRKELEGYKGDFVAIETMYPQRFALGDTPEHAVIALGTKYAREKAVNPDAFKYTFVYVCTRD